MLRILSEEERKRIREAFEQNPLYAACTAVFRKRRAHLNGLEIQVEDVFCATALLLDTLYNTEEELTQESIDTLWDDLCNNIRDAKFDASEHDKRQVVHTIFAIVRKALCHHWETYLRETLFDMLGVTIDNEMEEADKKEMDRFISQLIDKSESLKDWVNIEYDGNLSDQIEACLVKAKPAKPKSPAKQQKKKPSAPPKGKHKAFPFISKDVADAYRMAQVADLCAYMNKAKADGGPMLTNADQRAFIKNFTTGNTTATILWLGSKRELHFIVSEWKKRKYITFDSDDDIWVITSGVFLNGKGVKKDGKPTPFDSDDLGSTHNPKNITQDLEDVVEMLNPEKPGKNFERFVQKEEERIDYPHKAKARKSYQEEEADPWGIRESWEEQTGYNR